MRASTPLFYHSSKRTGFRPLANDLRNEPKKGRSGTCPTALDRQGAQSLEERFDIWTIVMLAVAMRGMHRSDVMGNIGEILEGVT